MWLGVSIALSLLLTIVLNVGLRVFPDVGARAGRALARSAVPRADESRPRRRRVQVWTPWKAMILGSLILTVALNLVLWITRT